MELSVYEHPPIQEDASELLAELRQLLAVHQEMDNQVLVVLLNRTLALTEIVQKQGQKIKELETRLGLRSR